MTRLEALTDLRDKVEAGEFDATSERSARFNAFSNLSEMVFFDTAPPNARTIYCNTLSWGAYNGSVDAAVKLCEAVLPGWAISIEKWPGEHAFVTLHETEERDDEYWYDAFKHIVAHGENANPARALLLAILAALIEKEKGNGSD